MENYFKNYLKKSSLISLILSIVIFILAIVLTLMPIKSAAGMIVILGYILIASGVAHCISYFISRNEVKVLNYELAQSILSVLLGLVFVFYPKNLLVSIAFCVGIYLVINSVFRIQLAANVASKEVAKWPFMLFGSIFEFIFALLLIFLPFPTLKILLVSVGAILAITQLIDIYNDYFVLYIIDKTLK